MQVYQWEKGDKVTADWSGTKRNATVLSGDPHCAVIRFEDTGEIWNPDNHYLTPGWQGDAKVVEVQKPTSCPFCYDFRHFVTRCSITDSDCANDSIYPTDCPLSHGPVTVRKVK